MNTQKAKRDVYQIITDRVISCLERGVVPWKQSWTEAGLPQNLISGKPYRGINLWLLASLGFSENLFLTKTQLVNIGGSLKDEGTVGYEVVYWNWMDSEQEGEITEDSSKKRPLLRYYRLYNISQCTGIPEDRLPKPSIRENEPIKACIDIVDGMPNPPGIQHKEQQAYYHPVSDIVNMPKMKTFRDSVAYYDTFFHELIHSTGHEKRVGRKGVMAELRSGREKYSFEELIAEMGASYLKFFAGIMDDVNIEDNAGYIAGWLKVLGDDKKFVIYASSHAQKAVDYILNVPHHETETVSS